MRLAGRLAAGALVVLVGGCGVPRDAAPRPVSPGAVDTGLLSGSAPPSPEELSTTAAASYRVAFVADDLLTLVPRTVPAAPVSDEAQDLLDALTSGPDGAEHSRGLSTALPSDVALRVTALRGPVLEVAIEGPDADARRLPLSVGQVVLTLTSLPGVVAVRLTRDGEVVQAPLPAGELVSRALTAADYRSLLAGRAAAATPSPTTSP